MARPDFVICLECESEVEDFVWREGEIRRVSCEVCGNTDPEAFSLPEDFDPNIGEDPEEDELAEDEDSLLKDYDDFEEEEEA